MIVNDLIPHFATGEIDNSFVGLKIIGNQIHFYFPESYHVNLDNLERDDFLDLLKTISIAKSISTETVGTFDSRRNESELALLSYIWIIEDYLKNGYYNNTERVLRVNQRGKINWKKTLQQQPLVSGRNIIYPCFVAEVKSPQDTIIVETHRYCIKKCLSLIGWIYGVSPNVVETTVNAEKMISRYREAIRLELDRTFDDEKHSRLVHMENVLIGLDESVDDKDIVYGFDSYNYIFARMINQIFGTENVKEYYPTFTWHLKYSSQPEGLNGPTIRPDTIMKHGSEENIYIIDSKYYRYGSLNLSQTRGLPEAASIVKQITYGSYVQSTHPENKVYNVFILPYDSKSSVVNDINEQDRNLVYIGEVSSDWENDKSYGKIYTFLVDLRYVVKTWNRTMHDKEKDSLVNKLKAQLDF